MLSLRIHNLEDNDPELITERKIFTVLSEYLQPNTKPPPKQQQKQLTNSSPQNNQTLASNLSPLAPSPQLMGYSYECCGADSGYSCVSGSVGEIGVCLESLPSTVENIWGVCLYIYGLYGSVTDWLG